MVIEIKTLMQHHNTNKEGHAELDAQLSEYLNDKWEILNISVTQDLISVVTLKRVVKPAREYVETQEQDDTPWMPGLTQNEAYELYTLAGGKNPDYSSTTAWIKRSYDTLIEKGFASIEYENTFTRRIPRVKITGAGIELVNSRNKPTLSED